MEHQVLKKHPDIVHRWSANLPPAKRGQIESVYEDRVHPLLALRPPGT